VKAGKQEAKAALAIGDNSWIGLATAKLFKGHEGVVSEVEKGGERKQCYEVA
jgi:hypothetical protein